MMHAAIGCTVTYTNPASRYYPADGPNTLTDGVRGTYNAGKYWHGFSEKDLIATVDLGQLKTVNRVSLGCLQKYGDWIFLPQWVSFEVSANGTDFTSAGTVKNPLDILSLIHI